MAARQPVRRAAAVAHPAPGAAAGPADLDGLRELVERRYEGLPARLQSAVRFLVDHPADAAVGTVKTLAEGACVQPSVMVRLAKALGYTGFSRMQAVFRDALLAQSQSYGERVRGGATRKARTPREPDRVLRILCDGAIESLQGLRDGAPAGSLQQAIALVAAARSVQVLGLRRAAPIAHYIAYLLSRSRKPVRQLGTMPGMLEDEVDALGPGDLLVVISFQPFHPQAVHAHGRALARGAKVLAITDSSLSPIAKNAHGVLQVHDADTGGFRSVASAMVLCHALAVGLAASDAAAAQSRKS
jgi:DNA-binding MurR/RpiR family transcriptional regulator